MKENGSTKKESRNCFRFNCQGMVLLRTKYCDEPWEGMAVNFSEDGICVLTNRPLKPGSGIYLRTAGQTETDPAVLSKPRSMAVAEVKRCEMIEDQFSGRYCLGLKYLEPS